MARRLLTLLTVLSLLLCVAVCVLWVRSYFVGDTVRHSRIQLVGGWNVGELIIQTSSGRGGVEFHTDRVVHDPEYYRLWRTRDEGWEYARQSPRAVAYGSVLSIWNYAGFGHASARRSTHAVAHWVRAPYWFPALALALAPGRRLWRRLRRRPAAGCCPACGYDLRATPDRCPECGRTV